MAFKSISLAATALVLSTSVNASLMTVDAIDRGYYNPNGSHNPDSINYYASGDNSDVTASNTPFVRNFFMFDLTGITTPIISATFRVWVGTGLLDSTGVYTLSDITSDYTEVMLGGIGKTDIYNDLGTGHVFGVANIDMATDFYEYKDIVLNNNAITVIQNADGLFGFGGSYVSTAYLFGYTHMSSSEPQLILEIATVPIPSAVWLFGSGLLGLVGVVKRKKA